MARLQRKERVFGEELGKLPLAERAGPTRQKKWMLAAFAMSRRKRHK